MTKTCPECKSKSSVGTAFCSACYYRFDAPAVSVWKYRAASVAAGLAVAICHYVIGR